MRDLFKCVLPAVSEEPKERNSVGDVVHISTNCYHGFHPNHYRTKDAAPQSADFVPMDVDALIPQNERPWAFRDAQRKRRWECDAPVVDAPVSKRQCPSVDLTHSHKTKRKATSRLMEQEQVEDGQLFEELLKETHGTHIFHWAIIDEL